MAAKQIFFLAGNESGNLGDVMLNRGLLSVLQRLGEVHVDRRTFS